MKGLMGRAAGARGVIIFSAIVLALAMVLPVLADGPNGHGGKPDKTESDGQSSGGGQAGDTDPKQAGQGQASPDQASSQGNRGQGRPDQAGSQGNQGQGKAHPNQAGSQDIQGQGQSDQASSPGNKGQGKARPDQAGSQDIQGQSRSDQAGSHGNKGKSKLDPASSLPSLSQAQGMARSEQGVESGRPGLANTQTGRSRLQANQAPGAGVAFTPSNEACNLDRSRGKPQSVSFPFSSISQGGSFVTISNTGGLKNLRITVNGKRFQVHLDNQTDSIMVDVDVSSALLASDSNPIEFTALGKPGTCAMVLLR